MIKISNFKYEKLENAKYENTYMKNENKYEKNL